jgi:mersacidin/lichenicidin family type 2 lantibiotic
MSNQDIIRAWKDEEYRLSLIEAERALDLAELERIEGGFTPVPTPGARYASPETLPWAPRANPVPTPW